MLDIIIIGAGVIGGLLARELSRYHLSVCLLDKENDVACGASKANSGIIHGGYDPMPGTLKARLNVAGVPLLYAAAKDLHVPYKQNGSLVCAFDEEEKNTVQDLYARGIKNGVSELELLTGDEARALEPQLSSEAIAALHVPTAGIICPYMLTIAAVGNAMDNGVVLRTNFAVTAIQADTDGFTVQAENGEVVRGRYLINCAGGYADRIAAMAGDPAFTLIPRAGEYLLLDKIEGERIRHTIFQVPSAAGKGVLVTPTVDGNLLTGPTAHTVASPAVTGTTSTGMDTVMTLAAKSVPSINFRNVITSFAGVRASENNGDFIIHESDTVPRLIHIAAIDSPGLTASVAIARYAVELLQNAGLVLKENPDFNGQRENTLAFREMDIQQKATYIAAHPAYGKIVCRCETVSEGEIRDAIRRNPPATDIDGIKRRTRAGMGRCQGGFCMPYVLQLIAEETGMPPDAVTKKGYESRPLVGVL